MGKGRERFPSAPKKTVVWWDINSCPVPDGVDPGDVRARIESALKKWPFKIKPQEVTIFAVGNLLCVPAHYNKAISSSGIFMRHGHFGLGDLEDAMDRWKRSNPPPATIILITEDPDSEEVDSLFVDASSGGKYTFNSLRWENVIKETTHHVRSHMLEDAIAPWACTLCWFGTHTYCGFANHLYGAYHALDFSQYKDPQTDCYQEFLQDLKREEASIREVVLEERRVQHFWLSALKNNQIAAKEITERDEGALKYLKAIKCKMVPTKGFKLKFFFTVNPYFDNTVLTKTYPTFDKDKPFFAKAIGTKIEWYPGKCLTQDCESFFNFFSPLQTSKGLDDDTAHKLQAQWEHDYAIRCTYITLALKLQAQMNDEMPYTVSSRGVPRFTVEADDLEMEDSDDDLVMEEMVMVSSTKKKNEIKEDFCKTSLQAQGIAVEIEGDGDEYEHEEEEESDQGRDVQKKSSGTRNVEEKPVLNSWLSALKNNEIAAKEITERDEGALKYLNHIEWKMVPTKGLKLKFFFTKNPYFKNTVLTKTYPTNDKHELFFAKAIGTKIEWYPGKCSTQKHKVVKKKGSKQITKTEDCESFFNFFSPLQVPHSSKGLDDDTIHKLEHDFAIRYAYIILALDHQGRLGHDCECDIGFDGNQLITFSGEPVEADDLEMEEMVKKNEMKEAFCKRSGLGENWNAEGSHSSEGSSSQAGRSFFA